MFTNIYKWFLKIKDLKLAAEIHSQRDNSGYFLELCGSQQMQHSPGLSLLRWQLGRRRRWGRGGGGGAGEGAGRGRLGGSAGGWEMNQHGLYFSISPTSWLSPPSHSLKNSKNKSSFVSLCVPSWFWGRTWTLTVRTPGLGQASLSWNTTESTLPATEEPHNQHLHFF